MSSTLEQIQKALENSEKALAACGSLSYGLQQIQGMALSIEQTSVAHGKLLLALVRSAIKKGVLTDKDLEEETTKIREEDDKNKMEALQKRGITESSDFVSEKSIIAVSNTLVKKDGTMETLTSYRVLGVDSQELTEEVRKQLLNKKVGDSLNVGESEEGQFVLTVLEIQNVKEMAGQGEQADNQAAQEA